MKEKLSVLLRLLIFLVCAILLELFGFNHEYFESRGDEEEVPVRSELWGFDETDEGLVISGDSDMAGVAFYGLDKEIRYLYVDVSATDQDGKNTEASFDINYSDEGNAEVYNAAAGVPGIAGIPKLSYHRLHSYGKIDTLRPVFFQGGTKSGQGQ